MSDMKLDFQDLASELINDVFADVSVGLTLKIKTSEVYDDEQGKLVATYRELPVDAILGAFRRDLINAQDILVTDTRAVVPFQSFDGHEPVAQADTFISEGGVEYTIQSVLKDAAEATYVFQLRETK